MRVAVIFGSEIGLGQGTMIGAILAVQFIGVPCAFLFGQLAGWIGTKRAILSVDVAAGRRVARSARRSET